MKSLLILLSVFITCIVYANEPNPVLKQAEAGDNKAQCEVAAAFEAASNYSKAQEWYLKAAQQGNAGAQRSLGFLIANGKGSKADLGIGCGWIFISKDPDSIKACFASGISEVQLQDSMNVVMTEGYRITQETGDSEKGALFVTNVMQNIDKVMTGK